MASTSPFPSYLFDLSTWDLQDDRTLNNMILFLRSFTHSIIHPDDGRSAPPHQTSLFIELLADPKFSAVVQTAMPELWSNEGAQLALQNPWIWAMRSVVTKPLGGGNDVRYEGQTQEEEQRRATVNTAAVVVAALNILEDSAGLERLREIGAVKRVYAARLVRNMPQ